MMNKIRQPKIRMKGETKQIAQRIFHMSHLRISTNMINLHKSTRNEQIQNIGNNWSFMVKNFQVVQYFSFCTALDESKYTQTLDRSTCSTSIRPNNIALSSAVNTEYPSMRQHKYGRGCLESPHWLYTFSFWSRNHASTSSWIGSLVVFDHLSALILRAVVDWNTPTNLLSFSKSSRRELTQSTLIILCWWMSLKKSPQCKNDNMRHFFKIVKNSVVFQAVQTWEQKRRQWLVETSSAPQKKQQHLQLFGTDADSIQ